MSKKKRTFKEFKQGFYTPLNKEKCINKEKPFYRSFLEAKLMRVLDKNPNVLKWGNETVVIPYKKPGATTYSRYFVDFFVEMKINDEIKKILIEVKPEKQCNKPTTHGNKKQSTILYENMMYAINQAKWEAAEKLCHLKGWKFVVITEKNIDTILGK